MQKEHVDLDSKQYYKTSNPSVATALVLLIVPIGTANRHTIDTTVWCPRKAHHSIHWHRSIHVSISTTLSRESACLTTTPRRYISRNNPWANVCARCNGLVRGACVLWHIARPSSCFLHPKTNLYTGSVSTSITLSMNARGSWTNGRQHDTDWVDARFAVVSCRW